MSTNERDSGPSSVTRTFSSDLNDAFSIDKNLDGLVQSVEQKKQALSSQSQELEAIEAKLRETEERLREKQSSPTAKGKDHTGPERQPLPTGQGPQTQSNPMAPNMSFTKSTLGSTSDQPPSASTMSYWRPQMPGALPETPGDARQNSYMGSRPDQA
ncbi:MAG: hypothetical protein LQ343_000367 [Gyalolechia ehrenbergii]|nr:MAG: hypothetical protein LQ343_000367 [Gyalolechia ehrenbergii]